MYDTWYQVPGIPQQYQVRILTNYSSINSINSQRWQETALSPLDRQQLCLDMHCLTPKYYQVRFRVEKSVLYNLDSARFALFDIFLTY